MVKIQPKLKQLSCSRCVAIFRQCVCVASLSELPWDQPTESCQEYSDWLQKKTYLPPWKKIQPMPLSKSQIILQFLRSNATFFTLSGDYKKFIFIHLFLQVCCPNYCWPVRMHASQSQTYRKTAGSVKASF